MKKNAILFIIVALVVVALPVNSYANSYSYTLRSVTNWVYSNYDNGSYVPKVGSHKYYTVFNSTTNKFALNTDVLFTLDSYNVAQILDYNNGGVNPHPDTNNKNCYLTIDQTAIPDDRWDLEIDGYDVWTNLPNPKIDIEVNGIGIQRDETEVVALGQVVANTNYYMYSFWHDLRDGGAKDGGVIQAQFAMSVKGVFDYNNIIQSAAVQARTRYGINYGGH